jgi:hypothetical protein
VEGVERNWIRITCPMVDSGISGESSGSATRKFAILLVKSLSNCGQRTLGVPRDYFCLPVYKLETKRFEHF